MTELKKRARKKDPELLEEVRCLPCFGCIGGYIDAKVWAGRVEPHHLITVKAGGPDDARNVVPLCTEHHDFIHDQGITECADTWGVFKKWLESAGWEFDPNRLKWRPPFRYP